MLVPPADLVSGLAVAEESMAPPSHEKIISASSEVHAASIFLLWERANTAGSLSTFKKEASAGHRMEAISSHLDIDQSDASFH